MSINCYCHPNHFECPVLYGDVFDERPAYPVPAIPVVVEWLPDRTEHPLSNSIFLLRKHTSCPCCGEMIVLAVFDFDSIRCFEHFFPIGEYINYREWSEGIEAYIEIRETDATVQ